jgi:hypothetical protein
LVERQDVCGCAFNVANECAARSIAVSALEGGDKMLVTLMGGKRVKPARARAKIEDQNWTDS